MALFPGFFPEEEDGYQQSSFLPDQSSIDPSQDMSVTPFGYDYNIPQPLPDFNIETPSIQPPATPEFNLLPPSIGDSITDAANAVGVRPGLALGVANKESSFNPFARAKPTPENPNATSQGLFGMTDDAVTDANKYATAHMQPLGNPSRTDPLGESLRGVNYLREALDRNNGNEAEALYDFNQGMGAPEDRPVGNDYADKALEFLPGGKIQMAMNQTPGSFATDSGGGGFGGGGGSGDTTSTVNQSANERIKMITEREAQAAEYRKMGMEAQKEAYAPTKLSRGDVFGAVGVPLIATLLGAAMNGKKGAKGGAVAGFQGAGLGLKVNMDEAEKKNKLAGEQAKYYFGEAKDLQNQQQALQAQQFGAEDMDRRYGEGTGRPANRIPTDEAYNFFAPKLGVSPEDLRKAAPTNGDIDRMLRQQGILQSSINLRTRQDFSKGRGAVFGVQPILGYENLSDNQKKNAGDIKAYTNSMLGAIEDLKTSYEQTGQVFMGADRAEQQANVSVLWSAARNLLKTGMRLEGKEQELVNALAPPQFDLDGITGVLKNAFLKDGPEETAARIEKIIKRDAASKLEANSQYAPEFMQYHSPAVLTALGNRKETGAVAPATTPTPTAGSAVPNKPGYLFDGTIGANGRPNIYKAQ